MLNCHPSRAALQTRFAADGRKRGTNMPTDTSPSNDRRSAGIRRRTILRGVGAVAGGIALGGGAVAQKAQTDSFPFSLTVPAAANPCVDEDVSVTGTLRLVEQGQPGDDHVNIKVIAHGTGVGVDSGTEWIWNGTFRVNLNSPGATTETMTLSPSGDVGAVRLISRGPAPNFLVSGFMHVTTNANGDVTAMKIEPADVVCRG